METLKYIFLFFLFLYVPVLTVAQTKTVQGIVLDKGTNQRVGKAFIKNDDTKENTFNNARGEFEIGVSLGDLIITSKEEYVADTIKYTGQQVLMVYLDRTSIYIPEVRVVARQSPEEVFRRRQEEYNKAYKLAAPRDVFSQGATGAGVSIDMLYGLFSKERKNAKRFTRFVQREYEEDVIDSKFTRDLVSNVTGLTGDQLGIFMSNYRPSYYFVSVASPYELTTYIKSKYEIFKLNPNLRFLPKLPEIDLEVNN
ncbi:hypothetical protein C5745_14970 [Sphingobacterium haloxyli]|uniref:Uncharacterized protein n=1 Tax=Sphingobacterium haloxyli TaxID=2100533 RepID=A0A2S9J124_9SPHI|nr:hypothetical protein C5745_14970 [Sphingobacterium haloxyli]